MESTLSMMRFTSNNSATARCSLSYVGDVWDRLQKCVSALCGRVHQGETHNN
jgi:hypothetical protein